MGPKKVDAEAKEKEYEEYKASEEYQKIVEISEDANVNMIGIHYDKEPFLSETSEDHHTSGRHQVLWDKIYELAVLMKVKPPFKKIEHQWMRSTYFGEKIKVNKDDKVYEVDGIVCEFEPEYADAQRHIKQTIHKRVTNVIRDIDENFDIENYNKSRTQIKKGLQEFFGYLKSYIKKPFKIIYEEKFMDVLKPFTELLDINMKLVLYQLKYPSEDQQFVNDFKKKAIVDRYCDCLSVILDLLMTQHSKPILYKIRPPNVFKKLAYKNLTKVESFYLTPFTEAFNTMKKGLCALMTTGINFWKVPVEKNTKFVEDLKALVNWQLVTERHFGSQLLRDQINFTAETLSWIQKANDISKKYMISKDPNSMEETIPRLLAFKTIQHMREYKDKEEQIRLKEEDRRKLMGTTIKSNNSEIEGDKQKSLNESPSNTKNNFGSIQKSAVNVKGMTLLRKDSLEEQRQNLGRYWIWENYCDNQFRDTVIEKAVQKLKDINKAVQQDIEDTIIIYGMIPRKDRRDEERISAAETLKNLKTYHNADKPENMRRPPQLWNFPKVVEEEHKFRSIAEPKKCYIDGRIEQLDDLIIKIGDHLRTHNKQDWNELIRRVIDFFDGTPNPDPAFE